MKTDCYIYTLITGDFLFQVMETSDEQAEKRLIDLYQTYIRRERNLYSDIYEHHSYDDLRNYYGSVKVYKTPINLETNQLGFPGLIVY